MTPRTAEIAGAGFAGLAAACALAQRGWRVRVHERSPELRTTGAGIYIYENGLRVLAALGAYDHAVYTAPLATAREIRDETNATIGNHTWPASARVYSIVRQRVIDALAAAARHHGAEILTNSEAVSTTPTTLTFANGATASPDLIVAADGINSRLRDSLHLLKTRRAMPDGAIRALIPYHPGETATIDENRTIEYWSGNRRVLYTPCSDNQLYLALTMLDSDQSGTAIPIDVPSWSKAFPHLAPLFPRIGPDARYDRFGYTSLKTWSQGHVAILGDAAHALPPNIGQGAGCAMMNALSLAHHLDQYPDRPTALAQWEQTERPLTQHTQRVSVFLGWPTTWPSPLRRLFFQTASRSKRLTEMRTRTARHAPTGT